MSADRVKHLRLVIDKDIHCCQKCPHWDGSMHGSHCKLMQTDKDPYGPYTDPLGHTLPEWCPLPDKVLAG